MTGETLQPRVPSEHSQATGVRPVRGVSPDLAQRINAVTAGMLQSSHSMDQPSWWDRQWGRLSAKLNRRKVATAAVAGVIPLAAGGVSVAAAINQPGQQPNPEFTPVEFDWSAIPLPRKAKMERGGFGTTAKANHIPGYEGVIGDKLVEGLHRASGFRKIHEQDFLGTKTEFFNHQEEQPEVEVLYPDLSRKDIQTIGIRSLRKAENPATGQIDLTGGVIPGVEGKFTQIDTTDKENPKIKLDNGQTLTVGHQFRDSQGNQYRIVAVLQDNSSTQRSGDRIAIQKYTPKP